MTHSLLGYLQRDGNPRTALWAAGGWGLDHKQHYSRLSLAQHVQSLRMPESSQNVRLTMLNLTPLVGLYLNVSRSTRRAVPVDERTGPGRLGLCDARRKPHKQNLRQVLEEMHRLSIE